MARPGASVSPILATLFLSLLVGCTGSENTTVFDPSDFEIVRVSGTDQVGLAGSVLPEPLVVQVLDRETGVAGEGAVISWFVVDGAGEVTRATSSTDDLGHAETRVILGSQAGPLTVHGQLFGLSAIGFDLTVLPAPEVQSITPTSAAPGDVVDVSVSDLPENLEYSVLFNGVEAEVVSRIDDPGMPTTLEVVVPSSVGICSGTANDVDVRIRAGGVTSAATPLSVTVPADPFQIGRVLVVSHTEDVPCTVLAADGGTAKYLLTLLSTEFGDPGQFRLTLGSSSASIARVGPAGPEAAPTSLHDRLRGTERQLLRTGAVPARAPTSDAELFAIPEVGSQREFWVLSNRNFEGEPDADDFTEITATLRYRGVHTLLYEDNLAPRREALTPENIEFLGSLYDQHLYEVDVDHFGQPTDIDVNNRVIILLSPVVNSLSERGSNVFIIGFFSGIDLLDPSSPGCGFCEFSNTSEMLYGIVPDPDQFFGDARSREEVLALLPRVKIHETEHLIDFGNRIIQGGTQPERLWLSEAMAHMAEEFGGDEMYAIGETELGDEMYVPNLEHAARYLTAPNEHSLTAATGTGSLEERGAGWLFLRWLAEQHGDFFVRRMISLEFGTKNVEKATGEPFLRLFADWAVTLWTEDRDVPNLTTRHQVPKWLLRQALQVGDPPAYALKPLQTTFSDIRSTTIVSDLAGTSPFYVEVSAAGDTQDLELDLDADSNAGLAILRYE